MAEPAIEIATEYVRLEIERCGIDPGCLPTTLEGVTVDLTDVSNALQNGVVEYSSKDNARGAVFVVVGMTTEDVQLRIKLWIDSDSQICRIDKVALASGVTCDAPEDAASSGGCER